MKRFRAWCYRQALKDKNISDEIQSNLRHENIAYNNWVSSLHKSGFPKNENGTSMNCWQLHDYYTSESGKKNVFVNHSKIYGN